MSDKELLALWGTLARKVLASILVDDGAIFAVHDILGTRPAYFPPTERPIFEAVLQCLATNTPPTTEAVSAKVNGAAGYVATIASQFNDDDNRRLVYNAEQLRDLGALIELKTLGRELVDLGQVADLRQEVDAVSTRLGEIMSGASSRDASGPAVSKLAWGNMQKQTDCIPTGFKWFDDLTGGLWPGMLYIISAAYKMGKTTTMRNAVMKSGSLNIPVGVFCAEGSRETFAMDCQAMLATEILLDAGYRGDDLRIDSLSIRRFYWEQGVFKKHELDAINQAREIFDMYPIYLWDTRDGINSLATFKYLVKKGRVQYGCKSFWYDYAGRFNNSGSIYERMSEVSNVVQDTAQGENTALCILAQKNEEQIKHGKGSYSPGVKGGGDLPAAADFLLEPEIDQELKTMMKLTLKFSRHTRTGDYCHFIIPASGMIADRWKGI